MSCVKIKNNLWEREETLCDTQPARDKPSGDSGEDVLTAVEHTG
jgi:hypothetical protein